MFIYVYIQKSINILETFSLPLDRPSHLGNPPMTRSVARSKSDMDTEVALRRAAKMAAWVLFAVIQQLEMKQWKKKTIV